jgi:hypothetical protein
MLAAMSPPMSGLPESGRLADIGKLSRLFPISVIAAIRGTGFMERLGSSAIPL